MGAFAQFNPILTTHTRTHTYATRHTHKPRTPAQQGPTCCCSWALASSYCRARAACTRQGRAPGWVGGWGRRCPHLQPPAAEPAPWPHPTHPPKTHRHKHTRTRVHLQLLQAVLHVPPHLRLLLRHKRLRARPGASSSSGSGRGVERRCHSSPGEGALPRASVNFNVAAAAAAAYGVLSSPAEGQRRVALRLRLPGLGLLLGSATRRLHVGHTCTGPIRRAAARAQGAGRWIGSKRQCPAGWNTWVIA